MSQEAISSADLRRLVEEKAEVLAAVFQRYQKTKSPPEKTDKKVDDDVFSPLLIVLIVIIIVLMVSVIIAIVCFVKIRRRYKKLSTSVNPVHDSSPDRPKHENGTTNTSAAIINNNNVNSDIMTSHNHDLTASMTSYEHDTTDTMTSRNSIVVNAPSDASSASAQCASDIGQHGGASEEMLTAMIQMGDTTNCANGTVCRKGEVRAGEVKSDRTDLRHLDEVSRNVSMGMGRSAMTETGDGISTNREDGVWMTIPEGNSHLSDVAIRKELDSEISGVFPPSVTNVRENICSETGNNSRSQHNNQHARVLSSVYPSEDADLTMASKLGDLLTPPTESILPEPSLSRHHRSEEGEEGIPEEPEPDYAKRVRFSAGPSVVLSNGGNSDEMKESEVLETGRVDGANFLRRQSSPGSIGGESADSAAKFWNDADEETTAL